MKRFIEGEERTQSVLFPDRLEDWVAEDNPVRVIDVFVDEMDLGVLGFERTVPAATGRPGYHPGTLLKIYIYGYLNRVQSSRRLEREAQRNVELIWLTKRLMPDFKTLADFRRDNGPAIRKVCARFVMLCRKMNLFTEAMVAIDGSKFKAVNTRDKNFTRHKIKVRLEHLEASIGQYLNELDRADREPASVLGSRVLHLQDKIAAVKAEMRKIGEIERELEKAPDQQVSLTDPDARSMNSAGKGTGIVGYNVQTAVDTKNHMIVAHEVTNVGHDRNALTEMAKQARYATWQPEMTVLADRGYFNGPEILKCDQAGFIPMVPKPLTSGAKAQGRFDKRDFVYDAKRDEYRCPAGKRAIYRFTRDEDGMRIHRYWSSDCRTCKIKEQCTPANERKISRWEHEGVLEAMQRRLEATPEASKWRRRTVEHTFGTLKAWMGATHFLTKTLPRVRTEMSLHVLAYNMKRAMAILGVQGLIQAMRA
jgi:transposase